MLMFGLNRRSKKPTVRKPRPVYDPTARFHVVKYMFRPVTQDTPYSVNVEHPSFTSVKVENITVNQF